MLRDRPGPSGSLLTGALHRHVRTSHSLSIQEVRGEHDLDRSVHPVLACAETIGTALKETADVQVTFMAPADKRAALLELTRLEAQLSALKLRVMAVADDVALAEGARDVAALVTHHTRGDFGANRRDLALAEALDRRWSVWPRGLGAGDLNVAQAQVITHALDELPSEKLPAEVLHDAEAHLVAQAAEFGPRELRVLGRRILDIVAPEIGEQHEAEQLAAEERRAERRTSLVSKRLGDGTTRITINVPDSVGHPAGHLPRGVHLATTPRCRGGRPDPGRPQARPGVLLAAGGHRPEAAACPWRRRHHPDRHGLPR